MRKGRTIGVTVLIFLCVIITWVYLEFILPVRTVCDEDLRYPAYQGDYRSRKKILDASHKILSHRIGNYYAAFIAINDFGNKDSIPYLISALKRLHQKPYNEMSDNLFYIIHCSNCLWKITGMEFKGDYEAWENWWEQTGKHLPFDEEKGQLVLPEGTK